MFMPLFQDIIIQKERNFMIKPLAFIFSIGLFLLIVANSLVHSVNAETNPGGQLIFILDASSSMLAKDGGSTTRLDKAKDALSKTLSGVPPETAVGLRVYGSTVPDTDKERGCQDTQQLVAPAANNAQKVKDAVGGIQAKGWTLMGTSLDKVQKDFSGEGPKTVILLSDGIDTCTPPDACEVAKNLSTNGVKIKVNTLGLLVDANAKSQLTCIATNSGGNYYDISDLGKLESTLTTLTNKEIELFKTQGIPIDGSLRIEDAPTMLPNTLYKDDLTVPQELFYSFEVKQGQKITVTVKGVGRDTGLGQLDYLRVQAFNAQTSKAFSPISSSSGRFNPDIAVVTYEFDTDKQGLKDGDKVAFKVLLDDNTGKRKGTVIPLELSFTTTGGTATDAGGNSEGGNNKDSGSLSPLAIVLITLGTVMVVAALGWLGYAFLRKKRQAELNPHPEEPPTNPTDPTPPVQ
jgi:Ca-activated chloride channel family protein